MNSSWTIQFSTDGIRAIAGKRPLVPKTLVKLGQSLRHMIAQQPGRSTKRSGLVVIIGRDTRTSSEEITKCLADGLALADTQVLNLGVLTTPAIAYLTRKLNADLGVSVTASHNPARYNGIKLMDSQGLRLQSSHEDEIIRLMQSEYRPSPFRKPSSSVDSAGLAEMYLSDQIKLSSLKGRTPLSGLTLVVDCANGAIKDIAPSLYSRLGATVIPLHTFSTRDATINKRCGSEYYRQYPQKLINEVRLHKADYGLAFDGDGDRLVIADTFGNIYNGDDFLFILACHYKSQDALPGNKIVTTRIANSGLPKAFSRFGITIDYVDNGDKNLEALMWRKGQEVLLGGEQVGNIIFNDGNHGAADPLFATLVLFRICCEKKSNLAQLIEPFVKNPQVQAWGHLPKNVDRQLVSDALDKKGQNLKSSKGISRVMTWLSTTEPGRFNVVIEGDHDHSAGFVRKQAEDLCREFLALWKGALPKPKLMDLSIPHFSSSKG